MFGKKKEPEAEHVEQNVCGQTLRLTDVLTFFKYNLNPSLIDAKIEYAIAKESKDKRGVPWNWIMGIGVAAIMLAIAYSIVNGQMQNNECVKQLASVAHGAVSNAAATAAQTGIK
jgi:hypothetical protein